MTYEETKAYFNAENIKKKNSKFTYNKLERFIDRIKRFKDEYEETCQMLSNGSTIELNAIRCLSVYDFEILVKHKLKEHERHQYKSTAE